MKLRIAIMGTRGIPANYGGFETFAEELSVGLVERGHEVTVYGRSNTIQYKNNEYKGVKLIILPTIKHKYFDTVAHTTFSVFHGIRKKFDIILVCNSVNSIMCLIPRLFGQKVVLNVDGLEWQRSKWNYLGKLVYRISECFAALIPNQIVTDSTYIEKYYKNKFNKSSTFIPYGSPIQTIDSKDVLKKFDIESRKYILFVSRLEPENNAHFVIKAFEKVKTDLKLVIVGDAPYNQEYVDSLKKTKDPRIIFTGYVFGQGYKEFQANSYFYIQATEVGGTHPALLEGMGYGNCVLANDVPEHQEVLNECGVFYNGNEVDDLVAKIEYLLNNPNIVQKYRKLAIKRIEEQYTWKRIILEYEKLFMKTLGR